jgi:hypothetical protein
VPEGRKRREKEEERLRPVMAAARGARGVAAASPSSSSHLHFVNANPVFCAPLSRARVSPGVAGIANVGSSNLISPCVEALDSLEEPFLDPSPIVYRGRLRSRLPAWRRLASPYVVKWIEHGVPIEFEQEPVAKRRKSVFANATELSFVRGQVGELLQRGCISVDPNAEVICPLGVAPKKGPALYRLIHNVRYVNLSCTHKHFKYEKLTDLQNVLKSGMWMCKFDLSAGYHHIGLVPSQTKFFGFEFEGTVYSWNQLFFGLSPAPHIFTMILRDIAKRWRFDGILLIHYLDDFLLFAGSRTLCLQQMLRIRKDLEDLGFVLNLVKSELDPVQLLEFLGLEVCTVGAPTFTVPAARLEKLAKCLRELAWVDRGQVGVRKVASVAGQLLSMSLALSPARLFTRALYKVVDCVNRSELPGGWNGMVCLSSEALEEVAFWLACISDWNGRPINREAGVRVITVTSDASHLHGWGGWTGAPRVQWSQPFDKTIVRTFDAQGRWTVLEAEEHINLQELRGFLYTAQALTPVIPAGARIRPRLDNTVAIAYLNNGGGRILMLTRVVKEIWLLFLRNGWVLETAVHIRGVDNVLADWLSRHFSNCDWKLNPEVFAWLDSIWGPHEHDRCASRVNVQNNLPFDSLFYEPGAAGHDTFTQWWRPTNNWVNGDFSLLSRLIALCREQKACATFIAPRWPRPWWRELCDECVDWRQLERAPDLFLPGNHASAVPVGLPPWDMFAFRLDYRQESAAWRRHVQLWPWRERHT